MRPVSNAFLDFQLTTLFDKIMPAYVRSIAYSSGHAYRKQRFHSCRCHLTAARYLFAQAKALDQRTITISAATLQVIQQLAATAYHTQQAAAGMMILDVRFEMTSQIVDTSGQ